MVVYISTFRLMKWEEPTIVDTAKREKLARQKRTKEDVKRSEVRLSRRRKEKSNELIDLEYRQQQK